MEVVQLWPNSPLDNFNYLITKGVDALVVDPFDFQFIKKEIEKRELNVIGIINTHSHWDHVKANLELQNLYNIPVIVNKKSLSVIPGATTGVSSGDIIFDDERSWVEIIETPGHTDDHICLKIMKDKKVVSVLSGDTLFNAGVGNCKNGGNPEKLYQTISHYFHLLSDEVLIYPGHDYLINNLEFTLSIESSNVSARKLLSDVKTEFKGRHCSKILNIGEEKGINTFFRLSNDKVRQHLKMDNSSDKEVFIKLRSMRDKW